MIPFFLGAAGGGAPAVGSVFGANPYSGNGGTTTITNGVNLATPGGLVWIKHRTGASVQPHVLVDSIRGSGRYLASNTADAEVNNSAFWTYAFNSTGWAITASGSEVNNGAYTYASWSFARAARFFDVVTYTGNNTAGRAIPHNLGTVPGLIIVKVRGTTDGWRVYHRASGSGVGLILNSTGADNSIVLKDFGTGDNGGGGAHIAPTATEFYVGTGTAVNNSSFTYVAYLFAHDTASDGIVQCGSYTGNQNPAGPTITLGWQPQFLLIKNASAVGDWIMMDAARGLPSGSGDAFLRANTSDAEVTGQTYVDVSSTGFSITAAATSINGNGNTIVYLAIRA